MTTQDIISQFLHTLKADSYPYSYTFDLRMLNVSGTPKTHSLQELKDWVEVQIAESQKGLTQDIMAERLAVYTGFCKIRDTYFPDVPLFEEDPAQLKMFGD